jgi:hypothetical protein
MDEHESKKLQEIQLKIISDLLSGDYDKNEYLYEEEKLFKVEGNNNAFKQIILELLEIITKIDNAGNVFIHQGNVLCYSYRPNIGFDKLLILNTEFNTLAEEIKSEKLNNMGRIMEKRRINKEKQEHFKRTIELSNIYQNLLDECDSYNKMTNENLTVPKAFREDIQIRKKIRKKMSKTKNKSDTLLNEESVDKFLQNCINSNFDVDKKAKITAYKKSLIDKKRTQLKVGNVIQLDYIDECKDHISKLTKKDFYLVLYNLFNNGKISNEKELKYRKLFDFDESGVELFNKIISFIILS